MSTTHPATRQALIREATEADLPRLVELYYQLSQLGGLPENTVLPVEAAQHTALRAIQADPRMSCYVLEVDGKVEGTLTLYLLPNLSHGARPFALVENVVVDDRLRSTGLGRLLMDRAEAVAATHGCYRVILTSNNRRPDAHAFYTRIGYNQSHQGFTKYRDEG